MASASLSEVSQELSESNDVMVDVRENTDMTVNLLTNVSDIFSTKLDQLISFMRGDSLEELESRREKKEAEAPEVVFPTPEQDNYVQDLAKKIGEFFARVAEILGITAGVLASPFIVIGSFFNELGVMTKKLDTLMKGGLSRFFSPIIRLFNAIGQLKVVKGLANVWTKGVAPFFKNLGQFFGLIDDAGKAVGPFGKIIRTASTVGRVLARFSGVLTVIIGAFEFITGFAEGFQRGGFIEGLKQGIVDAFDAIIGNLIRLIVGIPSFLLNLIGFNDIASSLSNFGESVVNTIITTFESAVDLIVGLFTLDFNKVKNASVAGGNAIVGLASSVIDLITSVATEIWEKFTNITHAIADKIVSLNIADAIANTLDSIKDWILEKISFSAIADKLGSFSVQGFVGDIAGKANDFLKGVLRSILPDPTAEKNSISGWANFLASRAIPDKIYEYAGLDPKTGEAIEVDGAGVQVEGGSAPAGVQAGMRLQTEADVQRDVELANQRSAAAAPSNMGSGSRGDTMISSVSNNTNNYHPRPSASSTPDNASDTMMTIGFAP